MLAQESRWQLGLESVLLMPTGTAPHKEIRDDPGAEVRAEMARRAAAAGDGLEVSDLELRREGQSYAFETLEELRAARPEAEPIWLMGADAALGFGSWRRPDRIVELAALGVAGRERVDWPQVEEALANAGARAEAIEMPAIGISSSMVRERVREGRPIRHLVPDAVAELIAERGLYGG